jgi:hypothetical protein
MSGGQSGRFGLTGLCNDRSGVDTADWLSLEAGLGPHYSCVTDTSSLGAILVTRNPPDVGSLGVELLIC